MELKPATLNDIPELIKLINGAYRGDDSKQGWTTEADLLDGLRIDAGSLGEMINSPDAVVLQAFDEKNALQACVYLEKKEMLCIWECSQCHRYNRQKVLGRNFYMQPKDMRPIINVRPLK